MVEVESAQTGGVEEIKYTDFIDLICKVHDRDRYEKSEPVKNPDYMMSASYRVVLGIIKDMYHEFRDRGFNHYEAITRTRGIFLEGARAAMLKTLPDFTDLLTRRTKDDIK